MAEPGVYADEHVDGRLLRALKRLGWSVVRAADELGEGKSDEAHFARAAEMGLLLLSNDDDMLRIAADWMRRGKGFPGLVYWHPTKYERVGDALRALLSRASSVEKGGGTVFFL